jgi:phosphonate transport system substrate-binding protein
MRSAYRRGQVVDILKAINAAVLTVVLGLNGSALAADRGTKLQPLQVVLIPADGGTEDGTRADFLPVFNAVSRSTGLTFELRVGQSYNAVVEAMCSGSADIAFFGPVSYVQARQRGCAELLAVAVENGKSIYYAGIFTRADAGIATMEDLKGKSIAFGDINSASAFVFPMAMILDAKLDPIRDLRAIRLTGSHANSLAALTQRQVDAASLSFESFEKAINQGAASSRDIKVLARSVAIPNPPLGMNTKLSIDMKKKLKAGFGSIAQAPGVTPDMIRGYGGKRVEGYDSTFAEPQFDLPARMMVSVDDGLKGEVLKKAAQP